MRNRPSFGLFSAVRAGSEGGSLPYKNRRVLTGVLGIDRGITPLGAHLGAEFISIG
jgi:hypothetical protein